MNEKYRSEPHPRINNILDDASCVVFRLHTHDAFPQPISSPADFAQALGIVPERITKTLLLAEQSGERRSALVCVSSTLRIDIKYIAKELGFSRMQIASEETLQRLLDYPRHGVSPLGAPLSVPVLIDAGVFAYPTILIGGGKTNVEIEISPDDLLALTKGRIIPRNVEVPDAERRGG